MKLFQTITTVLLSIFCMSQAVATISLPPELSEVVIASESVGIVLLESAENYYVKDKEGPISCGIIYQAKWVDSLTGDEGEVRFVSRQNLLIRSHYLIYLGSSLPPRKLVSTNSISEAASQKRLKRERRCKRTKKLSRTVYRSTKFPANAYLSDEFRVGLWVEYPRFRKSDIPEIVITPTTYTIDGKEIDRVRALTAGPISHEYQLLSSAGPELLIFRATEWDQYCNALIKEFETQKRPVSNKAFCDFSTLARPQ